MAAIAAMAAEIERNNPMEKSSKIFVAGHNGLVGSALVRRLNKNGFTNLVFRSHAELDLTNQPAREYMNGT
jgi:GDP-L-fucose synthase